MILFTDSEITEASLWLLDRYGDPAEHFCFRQQVIGGERPMAGEFSPAVVAILFVDYFTEVPDPNFTVVRSLERKLDAMDFDEFEKGKIIEYVVEKLGLD